MKLKYYLRGAGIGIIFATLIMAFSSFAHRFNLSDEYIIKEARKLGMVMKEEIKDDDGLWGSNDTQDVMSEITEETEATEATEITEITEQTENSEPEVPVVPETPVQNEDSNYVTIAIVSGDTPRKVGEKLVAAGIIDDEVAFMNYVGERGYAYKLRKGNYSIPKEATFEEICRILFG